jgi:threonine aldolase
VDRLSDDHRRAAQIGTFLKQLPWVTECKPVATNIVIFRLADGCDARQLQSHLAAQGIGISAMDARWLRAVTHYDVADRAVEALCAGLGSFAPRQA